MSIEYEMADEQSVALLDETMGKYHGELKRYELRVGLIMAFGEENEDGEIKKRPVMKDGQVCAAKIRNVPLKDRLTKKMDLEIVADGDYWMELDNPRKVAILDHELEHIRLVLDEESGELQRDSLGRPRTRLLRDDIVYWGFANIAERHGVNSQEYLCFQSLLLKHGAVLNPEKK